MMFSKTFLCLLCMLNVKERRETNTTFSIRVRHRALWHGEVFNDLGWEHVDWAKWQPCNARWCTLCCFKTLCSIIPTKRARGRVEVALERLSFCHFHPLPKKFCSPGVKSPWMALISVTGVTRWSPAAGASQVKRRGQILIQDLLTAHRTHRFCYCSVTVSEPSGNQKSDYFLWLYFTLLRHFYPKKIQLLHYSQRRARSYRRHTFSLITAEVILTCVWWA